VAVLSDFHVGSAWNGLGRLQQVVATTNAQQPDLVLLLGDYECNDLLAGTHVGAERWAPVLGQLRAPLGVYAVMGNHDWEIDHHHISSALREANIRLLENVSVEIPAGNTSFWLAGIGDHYSGHDRVHDTLRNVTSGDAVLAMTHSPGVFDLLPQTVNIAVAGHTHGGQVSLPLIGAPGYSGPYIKGRYAEGEQYRYVTAGLGSSFLPIRMGSPPEIVLLSLGSPEAKGPAPR
jgi:predicted MPP superfamily phosphohydrolase